MNRHASETVFDAGIFLAAAWLFIKTAHVMSYFSPDTVSKLLGFDVSYYFGMGAAALVEIIAIAFHYWPRTRDTLIGKLGMWSLLAISGLCQIVDGYLVQGTQAQMGPGLKDFLTVGVPLVPLYALMLLFAAGAGRNEEANAERREWAGIATMWDQLLHGNQRLPSATPSQPRISESNEPIPAPAPLFKPATKREPTNPTQGRQNGND